MKKILITGSEGFIGSHLVERLIEDNYSVTALVKYNFKNDLGWLRYIEKKAFKKIKIVMGDITDYELVNKITKNKDIVINLAALIGIPYSYKAVESYISTNVLGTFNILKASKNNNVKKIIHTSTSEVYGGKNKNKIKENYLNYAQSPYAASKIAADQLCNSFYCSYNTPVIIVRPFNTFGPRQSDRAIIPTIINQLINSNKLELGNINTYRDLNFIEDTIEAFIKILKCNKKIYGETINIGSGFNFSINKIAKLLINISGKKAIIKKQKIRIRPIKSEVNFLLADNSKIKKLVGWKPKYNNYNKIKIALTITYNWFKNNQDKYKFERKYVE